MHSLHVLRLFWLVDITLPVINVNLLYRVYYDFFGVHPNLWKFCRRLRDLQEIQENEELQHIQGHRNIRMMKKQDRIKESVLERLRDTFLASDQSVLDGYNYISKVAFKMRKYNINSDDVDNYDAP